MNHSNHSTGRVDSTDVVIVGAGPIGIEMAVALRRRGLRFEILESGVVGQTMSWWAPQTRWFSSNERIAIAGVPLITPDQSKATREEYLNYLRGVVMQFDIRVRTGEKVVDVARSSAPPADRPLIVTSRSTAGRRQLRCKGVVLAIGGTDFPRRLSIPGEDLPHVDGYLRETHRYFGRRVLIIGGRNSAIEAALRLHHVGARVSLSYRGDALPEESIKYWLRPEINGLIAGGRIAAHFATRPTKITPTHVELEPVGDSRNGSDQIQTVAADDVLCLIGYEQDKTLFETAGIELVDETRRPKVDIATMRSNVPGVYVAGTAVAGTQNSRYKTFLENCHEHIDKIIADLTGQVGAGHPVPVFADQVAANPES